MKHYHVLNLKKKNGLWVLEKGLPRSTESEDPLPFPNGFDPIYLPSCIECNFAFSWLDDNRKWMGDKYNPDAMCITAMILKN